VTNYHVIEHGSSLSLNVLTRLSSCRWRGRIRQTRDVAIIRRTANTYGALLGIRTDLKWEKKLLQTQSASLNRRSQTA